MLAKKVRDTVKTAEIDVIVPVPMHQSKLALRGFNQAELLAREVGREIRKPVIYNVLQKRVDTPAQTYLHQQDRAANLRGAFYIVTPDLIKGAGVLLVDDIFTTGSTAAECSRTLLEAGAKKVFVATVATGIYFYPKNNPHP